MLNIVVLMGRLVSDPELRHTSNDIAVTSFTIAVNRKFGKAGEERTADFIDIVAWRNTAEFVCKYFRKGQMIAVDGAIQTRTYEDKDGNKRKAFEVVANNVNFTESKKESSGAGAPVEQKTSGSDFAPYSKGDDSDFQTIESDDDLPF